MLWSEMKPSAQLQAIVASQNAYRLALLTIFLAAVALRLYELGSESLWFDEAWSFKIAQMDPWQIVFSTPEDNNPPLYYLILHYWLLLTGDSEFAIRLPSAIASALAVPLIYGVGRMLFGRPAALMAALILSLSAYQIRYAQEARAYSLMTFLGLASFYFLLRLLRDGRSLAATIGYIAATTFLIYTHVYGIFLVIAQ
jgi:mannosyltransferase